MAYCLTLTDDSGKHWLTVLDLLINEKLQFSLILRPILLGFLDMFEYSSFYFEPPSHNSACNNDIGEYIMIMMKIRISWYDGW